MITARLALASLLVTSACVAASAHARPVPAPDNGRITLPKGFAASVVADGLDGVRGLAVSDDGIVYARVKNRGVVALRDVDGDGKADDVKDVPDVAKDGSGIGVHDGYLYFSSNSDVYRMRLASGQWLPQGEPERIVRDLPDRRQHNSKMFTFDAQGRLYVEVGSPSNALGQPDRGRNATGLSEDAVNEFLSRHGGIWRFDPSKTNQTQADGTHYSTGHRHILSLAWHPVSDALFVVQNGRDVLDVVKPSVFTAEYNAERVSEEMHIVREGTNLGWPYTFFDPIDGRRLFSPEYGGDGKKGPPAGRYPDPLVAFPAHWAPMQMAYYGAEQFPEKYRGGMFVAFHGSWNRTPEQKGYRVCFVPFNGQGMPTGEYETFADGFIGRPSISSPNDAAYRPMGVAVGPDGSLYIGSDHGGRVWRVFYQGE